MKEAKERMKDEMNKPKFAVPCCCLTLSNMHCQGKDFFYLCHPFCIPHTHDHGDGLLNFAMQNLKIHVHVELLNHHLMDRGINGV